jgi:hypothetical protein
MTPPQAEPQKTNRNRAAAFASILLLLSPFAPSTYGQSQPAKLADISSAAENSASLSYKLSISTISFASRMLRNSRPICAT